MPNEAHLVARRAPVRKHWLARRRGFTLIELMIAVAVVAILAAVALPAYKDQIARGRRSDMQTVLLEDAQYMQRYYAANNSYTGTGSGAPALTWSVSPRAAAGTAVNYNISILRSDATSYTLQAEPVNAMAGDRCGTFTYDDQGQKQLKAGTFATGQSVATCWR